MKSRLKRFIDNGNLHRVRFWIQLITFVFFIYGGYLALDFGSSLPVFACPYNEGTAGACYFLPLQHQLGMPAQVLAGFAGLSVLIGLITFVLWFIVLNKGWCGFVCPFGTLQDWITALRKRMGIRYSTYPQEHFKKISKIKFIFLTIVILFPLLMGIGVLGREWMGAFCQMCPARIITPMFSGDFSQWSIDFSTKTAMVLTTLGVVFTGLFFIGSFVKKRFFCFFCPMSALHYIFSKSALLRLHKDGSKCTTCGDCYNVCDMQIKEIADDVKSKNILMDDCTLCMKCVAACPEEGALSVDIVNRKFFTSTKEGFVKRMGIERPKNLEGEKKHD